MRGVVKSETVDKAEGLNDSVRGQDAPKRIQLSDELGKMRQGIGRIL
jgi:hypothetical protein